MTGIIAEAATPGDVLTTPSGRGRFTIARYTTDTIVLLLGEKEAWTPLPWRALEEIPDLLRAHDWILIGSVYSTDSHQGSLDEHLKKYLKRATAGWVAAVLEKAAVITIDRSRPAQIKPRLLPTALPQLPLRALLRTRTTKTRMTSRTWASSRWTSSASE